MLKSHKLCKPHCLLITISILILLLDPYRLLRVHASEDAQVITADYEYNVYHAHTGDCTGSGCYTKPVYHNHIGNCYESYTYNETSQEDSGWYWTNEHYHNHAGNGTIDFCRSCSECGICSMDAPSSHGHTKAVTTTHTGQRLICGKTAGQTIDSYELGCNLTNESIVGTIKVSLSPKSWSKQKDVLVTYNNSPINASINNDSTNNGNYIIYQNGTYNVLVPTGDGTVYDKINFKVDTIDNTPPSLSTSYDETPNILHTSVVISATDLGCGLADSAFSFDGGKNWTKDTNLDISENTTLNIAVRDKLGNISAKTLTINNLDKVGPDISYSYSPESDTYDNVTISFTANDIGCGLDEKPYSFDDGQSWESSGELIVSENGTYSVIARDKNGNTSSASCTITNIKPRPEPSVPDEQDKTPPPERIYPPDDTTPPDNNPPIDQGKPSITPVPDRKPTPPITIQKMTPIPEPKTITQPITNTSPNAIPKNEIKNNNQKPVMSASKEVLVADLPDSLPANKSANLTDILWLILLFLLALLLLLLFFLNCFVLVFSLKKDDKYMLNGILRIKKHDDCHEINIPKSMADNFETNEIKLFFPYLFRKIHKDNDVVIYVANIDSTVTKPQRFVYVSFRE